MEWLLFAFAVCLAVGIALYVNRKRKRVSDTTPQRLGGGTR